MIRFFLPFFLFFFISSSDAQNLIMGFCTGVGSYKMEELKYSNEGYLKSLPFEVNSVDEFPSWLFYKISLGVAWDLIETGLNYSLYSTGARYTVEDYSGKYQFDNRIRAEGPGIWFNLCLNPMHRVHVLLFCEFEYLSTTLIMDEVLTLDNTDFLDESYTLTSHDGSWEPGIKVQYPISIFFLEFSMSYSIQMIGKGLKWQASIGEAYLQVSGLNVHPEWNGYRLSLGLAVNLTKVANRSKN